jgi:hypothetical protein
MKEIPMDGRDDQGETVELRFTGSLIARSAWDGKELYLTGDDLIWPDGYAY